MQKMNRRYAGDTYEPGYEMLWQGAPEGQISL
jgi:hypothetical protein